MRNAFEPFFTTKPPGQGSGLGLSQVYGVATQSGGGVRIDSKLGAGTTVSVLFPRAVPPATSPPDLSRNASLGRPANKPRTVLVVDDEADLRETLQSMLSANGIRAILAADGAEALRLIDEGQPFDLLLVDYAMPAMNGGELAQRVRSKRPNVPIVFVTGDDGEWVAEERWVLTKPFLTRRLIDMLHAALSEPVQRPTSKAI